MKHLNTIPCTLIFTVAFLLAANSRSQQLQTLYGFAQPPGNPQGGVVQGPDGNFYGTTYRGGAFGYGAVFRVTTNGTMTDLADFNTANGAYPFAGLLSDSNGNFYGTTQYDGVEGYGTLFRITTNGTFTKLVDFYPAIGANPEGTLIWGNDGNIYGTTANGGTNSDGTIKNDGTIFQVTTNGVLNSFFSFNGANGANPQAGLFLARDGNFYGTTLSGGPGFGLGGVFRLTVTSGGPGQPPVGVLTNLGQFDIFNNGAEPVSSLVEDNAGNLYGTDTLGGNGGAGSGTVFEIPATNNQVILGVASFNGGNTPECGLVAGPSNTFYGTTLNTIFQFTPTNGAVKTLISFSNTNGFDSFATPVLDTNGNLYGTTQNGGTDGYGVVYELTTNTNLNVLFSFLASPGAQPNGSLVRDTNGTLYGTTSAGGAADNGTVFSLTTNGLFNVLVTFRSTNGAFPFDGLLFGTNGLLYATSHDGGGNGSGGGTVFAVSTNGQFFSTLATFNSNNGAYPAGGVISDASGNLYGTTVNGGLNNDGTVFKLDTNGNITTLLSFDFTNGAFPNSTLVLDTASNLWGTANGGGAGLGFGTIFKIPTSGVPANPPYVPFVSLNDAAGGIPVAGLTLGPDGAYYGTGEADGAHNKGTVFRVTTNGVLTGLYSFQGGNNGAYPFGALILGSNGVFYGTTSGTFDNQTDGNGTVFSITTNGVLTTYLAFNGTNGSAPSGALLQGSDGALYGTTQFGGPQGSGTIFKLFLGPINPTTLNIQTVSNIPVLTWTNPVFNLQAALTPTGPYTNVPNAFSPYTNSFTNRVTFFRLEATTN